MNPVASTAPLGSQVQAPPYRWLLFDADGTLFDYERAERVALEQALAGIGVTFEPGYLATYREINGALWQGVEMGVIKPGEVKVRRFERLLETIRVAHSPEALSAGYLECLANCSELIEDAEAVLGALHRKYRLAILTNGLTVVQRGRLARSAIRHHISDLIISEEIGAAKPAPEFFDKAFARLGHPGKREVLMIGDGWVSDIQGALQYGIDACWYNPGRKPRPANCEITREIASLRELNNWLIYESSN
ncbi:MAG TPA: YjjG family noncanonical pyrimidine nucleotidase [Candidatus Paceibacterota bacterium]|nr:YjjG family noncanonical pyrimidine nucleotidase [Verrucomicrobiota bacterium]HSA10694.1 YjjG family noncanonical pyrimidine nucleotidase [Candidatus Paceibacterota bacterium]